MGPWVGPRMAGPVPEERERERGCLDPRRGVCVFLPGALWLPTPSMQWALPGSEWKRGQMLPAVTPGESEGPT